MKIVSLFLFTVFFGLNLVYGQNSIDLAIQTLANDPELKYASISFKVTELETGEVISELNPILTLPTASTAKLFSTSTALQILGADYRAKTRLYYDGKIDSMGVLNGDIWIRGGGDPSLGSKYFNKEGNQNLFLLEWVKLIKALGITKINGSIIADASEFGYNGAPDGWNWVDMGNYYGAGPSGLTIYDNMLNIHFKTSSSSGRLATVISMSPEIPKLNFTSYVQSSTRKGDNAYIYGAPYSYDRFATGTLPVNSGDFLVKGSLPDPEFQFAYEFNEALINNGIQTSNAIETARLKGINSRSSDYASRKLIYIHEGEKLIDIIKITNMRSINLFAEHMICLIGYEKTGDGSTASGLRTLNNYWRNNINVAGLHVNDGSGLSRSNAISANHYVELLNFMKKSKHSDSFFSSLPIAGTSGTLRSVCKKGQTACNRLYAKSGTMTRIKSYAGYVNSTSGKVYAFAIIVNNHTCSSSALKKKMENVFNKIAGY
jgi:serine-type D-Ala-D-Ala carboxypeptidase/endopeptidase (penicillin-binding protein 4)